MKVLSEFDGALKKAGLLNIGSKRIDKAIHESMRSELQNE